MLYILQLNATVYTWLEMPVFCRFRYYNDLLVENFHFRRFYAPPVSSETLARAT